METPAPNLANGSAIVWIGKFRATYPIFWRTIAIAFAIPSISVTLIFGLMGAWEAVLIINAVLWLIVGASYLLALWLTHRPKGGPECLFAVTPEAAHYHAGDELRYLGQPAAQAAALVAGNLEHVLMLKGMQRQNDIVVPWPKAMKIEIHPGIRLIFVWFGWRGGTPLFCTEENFEAVKSHVLAHAPHARVKEVPAN